MTHLKDIEKYHTMRCFSSDKEYLQLIQIAVLQIDGC